MYQLVSIYITQPADAVLLVHEPSLVQAASAYTTVQSMGSIPSTVTSTYKSL